MTIYSKRNCFLPTIVHVNYIQCMCMQCACVSTANMSKQFVLFNASSTSTIAMDKSLVVCNSDDASIKYKRMQISPTRLEPVQSKHARKSSKRIYLIVQALGQLEFGPVIVFASRQLGLFFYSSLSFSQKRILENNIIAYFLRD